MRTIYLHGLESGPYGSKYKALADLYKDVHSPDAQGLDLAARLAQLELLTETGPPAYLVGSSLGGLVAALHAHRHPDRVLGMVLVAPALHWEEAQEITQVPEKTIIVHGDLDEVVPLEASGAFAAKHGLSLITTHDGHRLQNSLAEILGAVAQIRQA